MFVLRFKVKLWTQFCTNKTLTIESLKSGYSLKICCKKQFHNQPKSFSKNLKKYVLRV